MKKLIALIIGLIAAATPDVVASVIADFFVRPEAEVLLPLTDTDARLDLVDYFKAGIVPSKIFPDGSSESNLVIESMGDSLMTVASKGVKIDIGLFVQPASADTLIVVSTTARVAGREDSRIEVYDSSFGLLSSFSAPAYREWLTPDYARKADRRLLETVPFITAKAVLDPAARTITFVNTTDLTTSDRRDAYRPSIIFGLEKNRFKPLKPKRP